MNNKDLFKPFKMTSSQLENFPKQSGQFIITTDTNEIYIDIDNETRKKYSNSEIPNANETTIGGFKVKLDTENGIAYFTNDGTTPSEV